MNKIIWVMLLIFVIGLTSFVYAGETPEDAVIDYYDAALTNDVDLLLSTINMAYVTEYLASEELYRAYVASAFEVMTQRAYVINEIGVVPIDDTYAVAYINLTADVTWTEWAYPMSITKDMVVFLEKNASEWLVNFIIDRDLFDANQGLGMMTFYADEVFEIESENIQRATMLGADEEHIFTSDDVDDVNSLEWASMDVELVRVNSEDEADVIDEADLEMDQPDTEVDGNDHSNSSEEKQIPKVFLYLGIAAVVALVGMVVLARIGRSQ